VKPSSQRAVLRQFGFLSLTLVACFAVLEAIARLLLPATLDVPHLRVHPNGYYTWYPERDFVYHNLARVEPETAEVRINSDGLRGASIPPTKDAGEVRVLVIGDSFTAAVQLPEDRIFTTLLEERLAAAGGDQRYRVINAGFNGVSTAHELSYYLFEARKFDPDVVVLQMTSNDLDDNVAHGGFTMKEGRLVMEDETSKPSWWKGPVLAARDALGNRSMLFYLTYRSAKTIWESVRAASVATAVPDRVVPNADAPPRGEVEVAPETGNAAVEPPSSASVLLAELAARLADEANHDGARVITMAVPMPLALEVDDVRFARAKRLLETRLDGSSNRMIDMRGELLEAQRRGEKVYLAHDGHLDVDGHRIVADALAREIVGLAPLEPVRSSERGTNEVPPSQFHD
jgi:lysophospholipase L1-like esterase